MDGRSIVQLVDQADTQVGRYGSQAESASLLVRRDGDRFKYMSQEVSSE